MNAGSQRLKRHDLDLSDVRAGEPLNGAAARAPSYHDRELLEIAAFRLRDAAQRVASLASMTSSPGVRAELLSVCERLMDEERTFLMGAFAGTPARSVRLPVARMGLK